MAVSRLDSGIFPDSDHPPSSSPGLELRCGRRGIYECFVLVHIREFGIAIIELHTPLFCLSVSVTCRLIARLCYVPPSKLFGFCGRLEASRIRANVSALKFPKYTFYKPRPVVSYYTIRRKTRLNNSFYENALFSYYSNIFGSYFSIARICAHFIGYMLTNNLRKIYLGVIF